MEKSKERIFQDDILTQLQEQGWLLGKSSHYNQELALYPEDVISYVNESQPEQWQKFSKHYPQDPQAALLKSVANQLDKRGTLWLLRNPLKDRGAKIRLCSFKPDHGLNPETLARYGMNRLRVVEELNYSPNGSQGRIDLVLFVNGLPVATMELKSAFKQTLEAAKFQYIKDRKPIDPKTRKPEPLLTFKRGALVHFAVSQLEVAMTTRLAGGKTIFLPFNRGTAAGGAGNDIPETGHPTSYLWQEILQPDNLLLILSRYIHLQVEEKPDAGGVLKRKETLIFPRYHQWSAVSTLLKTVKQEDTGHKYLIQHSAGSGKSNSIAWLAHQLGSLYRSDGNKYFDSVIVITDRTVLDSQLQETIYQFEHAEGVVSRVNREDGQGSKSEQLAKALTASTPIIIVTIQTFPFVLEAIRENKGLADRTFAVIADEAHSSQSGATARKLREVLMVEQLEGEDEITAEDVLNATLSARRGSSRISYFAFTATPKNKTLELFGRVPDPGRPAADDNLPQAFHVYTMRQAIEEGFILDVLKNYTSYKAAWKLAHSDPEHDSEVDSKKASTQVAKWVRLHPHNIAQKVEAIIEHFRTRVMHLLGGEAKAMVVTSSRKEAVRYKLALDKYVQLHGYKGISALVAFSGEVNDQESGPESFTENNMNPGLKGRDMRKAFDTNEYQVMLVANKFQTGFDQPKLVAMYVDKKLSGVDCVQTLSRLNRTYPGKDNTFVLDFVNDPEELLESFQTYYQTAELANVSDPNLVYEIQEKLEDQQIFQRHEVESFAEAYFDPKSSQDTLVKYCKPAVDRFTVRYKQVMEVVTQALSQLKAIKKQGNESEIKNAETSVKEAKAAKDVLDTFKKDLGAFVRYYEFSSQIVDFDDDELEKLSVFAKHLAPLLREERIEEEIDLSQVLMTHYKLYEQRQQALNLREDEANYIDGITGLGSHSPKDRETELLSEILGRMNDLFAGENLTDNDKLSYANTIADKVSENDTVMDQIRNNSREQAMLGDYPTAVQNAVIGSMDAHNDLAMQVLSSDRVAKGFAALVLDVLMKSAASGSESSGK
ncbi:restriction endonuclease subunit R [bacterium endosymbiont of Escarpia laminata]|nr:MAG: restriction endonuclease subunit R [bacterium endosymbiont of Escarpia laminata]